MNRRDALHNSSENDAFGKGVIAIVDDDPCISDAIKIWLNLSGFTASVHASAESLTQSIDEASQQPLLRNSASALQASALVGVILDINLGGMSGFDLAHRLRHRYPDLPIALITGRSRSELALLGVMPVNVPCLQKPFDLGLLRAALFH